LWISAQIPQVTAVELVNGRSSFENALLKNKKASSVVPVKEKKKVGFEEPFMEDE